MRAALLLLLVACGARRAPAGLVPDDLPLTGMRYVNAHLLPPTRDAAHALGGFVAPGAWPVDPGEARQTACTAFFEEVVLPPAPLRQAVFVVHPAVAARRGYPSGAGHHVAWAQVELGDRRVAAIADPHGLEACCAAAPDACTSRYVAEVLTGEGVLWRPDEDRWRRVAEVSGPFAFRLGGNPYAGDACGPWTEAVPVASRGTYFVAVSNLTFSEAAARTDALQKARQDARVWLRERGHGDAAMADVREERWCLDTVPDPSGQRFLAQVLLYVPVGPEG